MGVIEATTNGCEHSQILKEMFLISNNHIDYYNDHNISFEFKETFAKKERNMFWKIPLHQFEANYFVFFIHRKNEYFVHEGSRLKKRYKFNNKLNRSCIRYGIVRRNYLFKTYSLEVLKSIVNNMKE